MSHWIRCNILSQCVADRLQEVDGRQRQFQGGFQVSLEAIQAPGPGPKFSDEG